MTNTAIATSAFSCYFPTSLGGSQAWKEVEEKIFETLEDRDHVYVVFAFIGPTIDEEKGVTMCHAEVVVEDHGEDELKKGVAVLWNGKVVDFLRSPLTVGEWLLARAEKRRKGRYQEKIAKEVNAANAAEASALSDRQKAQEAFWAAKRKAERSTSVAKALRAVCYGWGEQEPMEVEVETFFQDYGVGHPGWFGSAKITCDGVTVAEVKGPYTNGPNLEFSAAWVGPRSFRGAYDALCELKQEKGETFTATPMELRKLLLLDLLD